MRLALLLLLGAAACGATPHTRAAGAVAPLAVRSVAWSPAGVDVGAVRAVADAGDEIVVFGDAGAAVLAAGAVVATDRSVTDWVDGRVIAAADGTRRWIVGIDGRGRLLRLRGGTSFEDVSERFGLEGHAVRAAATLGPSSDAFLVEGDLAVATGGWVARLHVPALAGLSGASGRAVGVDRDGVVVVDARARVAQRFPLPGATQAILDASGRLVASTARALYVVGAGGDLEIVYDAERGSLRGLVASGDHVWFVDGSEVGLLDGRVSESAGADVPADARLAASPGGDVWVIGGGTLRRFTVGGGAPPLQDTWASTIAPLFARACATCHAPAAASGIDLSSPQAWLAERGAIADRVIDRRTMPPDGHPLSEADRAAIAAWARSSQEPR